MATVIKRGKKYVLIYDCGTKNGKRKQKWVSYHTKKEALKAQDELEFQQQCGKKLSVLPSARTVKELMDEFVNIYGTKKWALSTYESNISVINHYILPMLGDLELQKITPRMIDVYYKNLEQVEQIGGAKNPDGSIKYLSTARIKDIHKLLSCAFKQAVHWEMIERNPAEGAILPTVTKSERDIWHVETIFQAIELCEEEILKLCINMAFACSLRIGELMGLTWDCVDIREKSIESGDTAIYVNKEIQRVSRNAMEKLNDKGIHLVFPITSNKRKTVLVLKEPKTESSIRRVYLPKSLAYDLRKYKEKQKHEKEIFGPDYSDYKLVFCHDNGMPMDGSVITRKFQKLIEENQLPKVVFHSLRHSSITYKLKLNGGDMKSVQGDSGHSQLDMIADVYSHILDEDRRTNAQRMEDKFYSEQVRPRENGFQQNSEVKTDDITVETLKKLIEKPEVAEMLVGLLKQM